PRASGSVTWSMGCRAGSANSEPYYIYTNPSIVTNSMNERAPAATSFFDYNCGIASGTYAYNWNNGGINYSTFAAFQSGTGQEAHGVNSNTNFTGSALHIGATS